MKISFDISQTGSQNKAGCGYYAHSLIDALLELDSSNEYSLLPSFGDFYFDMSMPSVSPYPSNVNYGPMHSSLNQAREFWLNPSLEGELGNPDLIHANNFWCPTSLTRARVIYTFYDFGFLLNPDEWTTEINRQGCFNGTLKAAMAADWIVAISKSSADHFLDTFPHFPAERVKVIYPSARFESFSKEPMKPNSLSNVTPNNYWLCVGTIEPRKNLETLIEAFKEYLKQGGPTMPLVIAGGSGWMMDQINKLTQDEGLQAPIILTGYVSDEELAWLYQNCYANLYPSLFEGFGLPILEAMQMGAPTMCSNTSSMPEVAGDAAILINPKEPQEWCKAMLELASDQDLRSRLKSKGFEQAKKFTAAKKVESILKLYDEALRAPKR